MDRVLCVREHVLVFVVYSITISTVYLLFLYGLGLSI
jgi:hypothetical protein